MNRKTFNFFHQAELPAPSLEALEVEQLCHDAFGVEIKATPLGSHQDLNFTIFKRGEDQPLGILKISNPAFSESEIQMQVAAAALVAERCPDLRIPRTVVGPRGELAGWWDSSQGKVYARVADFIPGKTLTGSGYLAPAVVERMGELVGKVSAALSHFSHPASTRVLQWDLQHASGVIDLLLPLETKSDLRNLVVGATDSALHVIEPIKHLLPVQISHFDLTDDNVLRPDDDGLPDAVIDFGDATASWAVGDLAVTVASMLHHDGFRPIHALPAIRAFHRIRPLDDNEIMALWALVTLRAVVLALSGQHQVRVDEQNSYAQDALESELRILQTAISVPPEVMTEIIRRDLGVPSLTQTPPAQWSGFVRPDSQQAVRLDPSTVSPINDRGSWIDSRNLEKAALSKLDAGADLVFIDAWQPMLADVGTTNSSVPANIPTGVMLWLSQPEPLEVDSLVNRKEGSLELRVNGESLFFTAEGIDETTVALPARCSILVQRGRNGFTQPPPFVTAEVAAGWEAIYGNPAEILGLPHSSHREDDLLYRREKVLAGVQEHYYPAPPRFERGWKEFLISVDGRVYLDMINNVTSVGHSHPHISRVASRQLDLINTNSRFHYGVIAEYAERITATLPTELNTVFFVNSGSEANDLAIRLAMTSTGRDDIVAMREAYHGWTLASDAISTSISANPNALASRPSWVHTVDAANSFRGKYRGAEAENYALEAVSQIHQLADDGRPAAAFICEPYYGNAGGIALPDGYLSQVYAAIRKYGGLAIADEVQVGFGRLGEWFWGFQQQQVIPDIVTVAKSIGAGQPIGVVVTKKEVADEFRKEGGFFSSTGGSPLSSAIGIAVLDILQDEKLQENARVVGGYLKAGLEALLSRTTSIIGQVHGSGLYLGVEFVRDMATLEPATSETMAICDRLLDLGVIMQPTGEYMNILKIKPPLCISLESADFFLDQLDRVLTTGW